MESMKKDFPLKPIKRTIKQYYNGEISIETIFYVRDVMLDFVNYLAKEAVEEFKEYNKRREKQNLPPMKRLDRQSFEKVADTLFNKLDIKNTDKAEGKEQMLYPPGDTMYRRKRGITKDAVEVA